LYQLGVLMPEWLQNIRSCWVLPSPIYKGRSTWNSKSNNSIFCNSI